MEHALRRDWERRRRGVLNARGRSCAVSSPRFLDRLRGTHVSAQSTAQLLEAWRKAQRASDAARHAAEVASGAALAAAEAAEAARRAAEAAGLTLDEADIATAAARDAYAEREQVERQHQASEHRDAATQPKA